MTAFVSEFLLNPVLRQARRLSEISMSSILGDISVPPNQIASMPALGRVIDDEEGMCDMVDMPTVSPATTAITTAASRAEANELPTVIILPRSDHELAVVRPVSALATVTILPDDDGKGILRRRIQEIYRKDIPLEGKGKLMHEVLMEGYRRSRSAPMREPPPAFCPAPSPCEAWEGPLTLGPIEALMLWPSGAEERLILTMDDVRPTRSDINVNGAGDLATRMGGPPLLGCSHYIRNVKLQCSTCSKWYTCRFCHDLVEDHILIRKDTKNMLCMLCGCPQRASDVCVKCGEMAARYYCNICKFWDDHPDKPIYHCNDCGICRRGAGLGKDFFHCKTCQACISIHIESSHKCIERSIDCDCPICGEYLFTSPQPVVFMRCGHSIHVQCYDQYIATSYRCPICNRSLFNMETQFRNLEAAIESQPMPVEFQETRAVVLCNDCSARSSVKYHWLGLKCAICDSYNTVELQTLGPGGLEAARLEAATSALSLRGPVSLLTSETGDLQHLSDLHQHSTHLPTSAVDVDEDDDGSVGSVAPASPSSGRASAAFPCEDSDDDMLGFWASQFESDEEGEAASGGEADSQDADQDGVHEKGDEEDEEDDVMSLIGHR